MNGGKITEEQLHRQVAEYLNWSIAEDAVWFHPANGGARSKGEAGRLRAIGVKAGVPDIVIVWRGRAHFIELKTAAGRVSDAQHEMHSRLMLAGAVVTICRSLEEVEQFIRVIGCSRIWMRTQRLERA